LASVHVLVPAQRLVFAVSNGDAEVTGVDSSADGFRRYKELQQGGRTAGMVAFPNTLLVRGERDYLVDPGLIMQGAPVIGALKELGVEPHEVKDVILTHLHFDHAEGMAGWPQRRTYVHKLETEAPYAQIVAGVMELANLEVLAGTVPVHGPVWPRIVLLPLSWTAGFTTNVAPL
jgi:glyoxylase-like metal-dependent hydrolase (beta-lactamase superfamily II)